MKLSLTLTDSRVKRGSTYYTSSSGEMEDYTRVEVGGSEASAAITAALLRGIANEIDPPRERSSLPSLPSGTYRMDAR